MSTSGYEVVPIGWVESLLKDRAQAPRQGDEGAPDAWLVFKPEVPEGIRAFTAGTEIIVLTRLDRARRDVLVTRPRDDPARPALGVFSTRSPDRPNPIGLHRVQVIATQGFGSSSAIWKPWTKRQSLMSSPYSAKPLNDDWRPGPFGRRQPGPRTAAAGKGRPQSSRQRAASPPSPGTPSDR